MGKRSVKNTLVTGASVLSLLWAAGCGDGSSNPGTDPAPQAEVHVRKSWTSLSPEERKKYIDGVNALKKKTALSHEYTSACEGQPDAYEKNAYDYYVELHLQAFLKAMAPHDGHSHDRPHMGPHFLPWHREMLIRYEADLREVLGDPEYTVPYWDWSAPTDEVFSTADMGDLGACPANFGEDFGQVAGYLAEGGYQANMYDEIGVDPSQVVIQCKPKKLTRGSGCFPQATTLPTAEDFAKALTIPTYDVAPYDNLGTDEDKSFRQYVEGFTNEDVDEPTGLCKFAGCKMHGQVHVWLGGLMGSAAAPNDPIFFLHHANVDRLWAEWQDKYGDGTYPSEDPNDYTKNLFMFNDAQGKPVMASSQFDHRTLGYVYDTQK